MQASESLLRRQQYLTYSRNSLHFIEPQGAILCSQELKSFVAVEEWRKGRVCHHFTILPG
jgi:hypothetical protein